MNGRVTSTKLKNTATILVERIAMHPLYKKTFIRSKKYLVHDELGVKEGDIVEVIKCKPISRNKHWIITKVVGKDLSEIVEAHQKLKAEEVISEVMPEETAKSEVQPNSAESAENAETPKTDVADKPKKTRKAAK